MLFIRTMFAMVLGVAAVGCNGDDDLLNAAVRESCMTGAECDPEFEDDFGSVDNCVAILSAFSRQIIAEADDPEECEERTLDLIDCESEASCTEIVDGSACPSENQAVEDACTEIDF